MELFAADGHDAGGCERVTGKSGMRPLTYRPRATRDRDRSRVSDTEFPRAEHASFETCLTRKS